MYKNLRWKIILSLSVFFLFLMTGVYPILAARYDAPIPSWLASRQLRLGLDLQGGVHLVMRVHTDGALEMQGRMTSEQIREALTSVGVTVGAITVTGPTTFRVEGVPPDRDAEFRRISEEQAGANYDRNPGPGGAYEFRMKPNVEADLRRATIEQALDTIDRRVNELGVAEPNISEYGQTGDQILVELPGIDDVARAKEIIRSTAVLSLRLVEAGPAGTREALLQPYGGQVPGDMEILTGAGATGAEGTLHYLVRRVPVLTGSDLRHAAPSMDEYNRPSVRFNPTADGARRFARFTSENIGRNLAIVLDNRVQSAPVIQGRIADEGSITGNFTSQETADLALILRSGALPAEMSYLTEDVIGPSLGVDSIRAGVMASLLGLASVVIFMLAYYRLSGINAIVAMVFNLVIVIGMMAYMGAAMTLPGIAGFILTMGIGVDSNVLIFERIKEELRAQRGVRASINNGFNRVLLTLLDTHITSLIAAAFLFQFGTGPIRGFATTLSVGLVTNLFTSVFVSKTLFELILSRRPATANTLSI
jgi:preprotein translocase subunit SecD